MAIRLTSESISVITLKNNIVGGIGQFFEVFKKIQYARDFLYLKKYIFDCKKV